MATPHKQCSVEGCQAAVRARGWCKAHYGAWYRLGDPLAALRIVGLGTCTVDGCGAPTRSSGADHCEKHYMRLRRHGRLDLRQPKPEIEHSAGYVLEHDPAHPLTTGGQRYVYQHRKVFFEHHGEGPFRCHVCLEPQSWETMHVDHLDDDPSNNDIDNLAPACPRCNQGRGAWKIRGTVIRKQGRMLTHDGQTRCLADWAREVGVTPQSLACRLKAGWSLERALTQGRGRFGPKGAQAMGQTTLI